MWEYWRKEIRYRVMSEVNEELNILGADNWEVIYYQENPAEKYGGYSSAKILLKRQKFPVCQQQEKQ